MPSTTHTDQPFLETPRGILSREGRIYHTTVAALESQYAEVLSLVPLAELMRRSELWLSSHRALTLWAMIPLLAYASVTVACVIGLCFFLLWKLVAPALGNTRLESILRLLSRVPAQMVGYIIAMSWFGAVGQYGALVAGLGTFVVVRWQLVDYLAKPITEYLYRRLYPLPVSDQMLRAVIHAVALNKKIILPQFPSISRWVSDDEG